jgi:hypothetical protein
MNSFQKFLKFLNDFIRESLYWMFFSIACSLIYVWICFLVFKVTGYPLHKLAKDALFVFSIITITTSFGDYYRRIDRKQQEWISFYCIAGGLVGIITSIALCTVSIISSVMEKQYVSAESLYFASKMLTVYAIVYGFILNTTIVSVERRLMWKI